MTGGAAGLDLTSSMAEVVISEVFKGPLLLDLRNKRYHNRNFVDTDL